MKATKLPAKDCSREEIIARGLEMVNNTCPFDVTGHPAMTVPCGFSDGLPIGMMLIGKQFDEATILNAAYAYEQSNQ
jgi:amidase